MTTDKQICAQQAPDSARLGESLEHDAELCNLCPEIIALLEAVDKVLKHTGSARRAVEQSGLREARKAVEESL
jgi:hypothetical protein